MIEGAEIAAFAGIMLLGQFSPGPDMLLLTRTSLADGARAGVLTGLGIATGLSIHGALAVLGLAWLLDQYPLVAQLLRWSAAAYLLWLSWKLLTACVRTWTKQVGEEVGGPAFQGSYFRRGLWCNLLNPKVVVFLASVTAPFLHAGHTLDRALALWLIIVIQGGLLWSLWAVVLQWRPLRSAYQRFQPAIDGAFGVVLLLLAGVLVLGR